MTEWRKLKKTEKNENRKPTKWAGKIWREKTRVRAHLGQNFKNIISSNFTFIEIALNGYLDKFLT